MPLIDNTFTGSASPEDVWDVDGNWSLGHKPTSGERAVIDYANNGNLAPSISGTSSVGAILSTDWNSSNVDLHNLTCIGALTGTALSSISLKDVGAFDQAVVQAGIEVISLTGAITHAGGWNLRIHGGNGTVTFADDTQPAQIETEFAGVLVADGVTVDLNDSVLSSSIRLQTLNGGSFTNYTGGPVATPPRQSGLSLGIRIGL
jgi:hypothetical protein